MLTALKGLQRHSRRLPTRRLQGQLRSSFTHERWRVSSYKRKRSLMKLDTLTSSRGGAKLAKNPSLIFTGAGKVEIQNREIPAPSAGEVLIKSKRSLISAGTELTLLSGKSRPGSVWSNLSAFPRAAGY